MRFEKHHGQTMACEHCGETNDVTVTVDTLAGVPGFTCPDCGKTQEAQPH